MSRSIIARTLVALALLISLVAEARLPGLDQLLPNDGTVAVAAGDQVSPDIAGGAGSRLAVWSDERANPFTYNDYETSHDIYGVRLADDGTSLDPVPIAIHAGPGSATAPKVAWNGSHWLVVFRAASLSGTGFYYSSTLAAVRVAPDGTVVDPVPIPLHGLQTGAYAVASDGNGWMVAAVGNDVTRDIVAVRIDADGVVLDPPTVSVVPAGVYTGSALRLAHAGGTYMLTFSASNGTGAVLIDSLLVAGNPFLLLDGAYISALGATDQGYYIAWNRQRPDATLTIMGARVSPGGVLLDVDGVDIAGASSPFGNVVGVAWDGSSWRIGWDHTADRILHVARVDASSGLVLNPGGSPLAPAQSGIMAGTGTGRVQLVWTEFADNEYDVIGATVATDDNGNDQLIGLKGGISTGEPRQYRSKLAAGADGYLLGYREDIAGEVAVRVQPLDALGVPVGPPVELDRGPTLGGPGSPGVAWNGSHYLVSWPSGGDIVARRIAQDGSPLDAAASTVMSNGFGPVNIAALNGDFLVVARRFGFTVQNIFPIGARVNGAGQLLDASPILLGDSSVSPFTVYALETVVATVGDKWLAAWHTNVTHDDSLGNSVGVFVDANGGKGNPFEIAGFMSTAGGNFIHRIAIASSGSNALFARSRELTSGVENDLELVLIDPANTATPLRVNATPWSGNQYRPSISFDGRDYIVVFQDQKNRLAPHALEQLDARSDLYGMRVGVDGSIIDLQGFLIDDSPIGETDLAVASRGSDTLIAASQMRNFDPVTGVAASANYRIGLSEVLDGADRFPVAIATSSVRSGDVPLTVGFSALGSFDPEGGAVSVLWDFGGGATSTQTNPSISFVEPGEYPVLLTVTDSSGRSASQAIMVQASAPNVLPVAIASGSPTSLSGPSPLSVQLFATGSYDPDGALGNIEWRISDGRTSFGSPAYFTFSNDGSYTATLRVYDSRGDFSEDVLAIEVGGANQPPTAQASAAPSSGLAPLGVALSASGSSDVDGTIVTYAWDFGDGSSGSGANPFHTYASVGTFVATVTVTDNSGDSDSASVTISVDGHSERSLLTSIDMSTGKLRGSSIVEGAVNVLNGLGVPQQSAIVTGQWTLPDGTHVNRTQYSDRRGVASFSVAAGADGVYSLRVVNVTLAGALFDPLGSETVDSITLGGGDSTPPAAPTGLVATAGDAQVSLDWADNAEADLAAYHVERATDVAGPFTRLTSANGVGASAYVDGGLTNGLTYVYRVLAVDTSGNESAVSASASATPQGSGGAATSLHIGGITLTTANAGKGSKLAVAIVSIVDDLGRPIGGATVAGEFSGSYAETATGTTGADGMVTLQTATSLKGGVSFGFCVTEIQHPNLPHETGDDLMTCSQF